MSAGITQAVERAGDAFTEAYQRAVREAPSNRQGQGITREDGRKCYQAGMRAGLAAALNGPADDEGMDDVSMAIHIALCEDSPNECIEWRGKCVKAVEALRTAILGADS